MNKIILIGRLTKDPELRYTSKGTAVASFTLAVDRPYQKDKEKEADFINIVVWGVIGENSAKYLHKGSKCAIDGRLQIRTYDGDDGRKRWITEVVANSVEFLDSKQDNEKKNKNSNESFGSEIYFDDDDVPF